MRIENSIHQVVQHVAAQPDCRLRYEKAASRFSQRLWPLAQEKFVPGWAAHTLNPAPGSLSRVIDPRGEPPPAAGSPIERRL
jgi:hypothetical protein